MFEINNQLLVSEIHEEFGVMINISPNEWESEFTWVNKEDAVKLIEHLQKQFKLC